MQEPRVSDIVTVSPTIRPVRWPDDEAGLALIDTSFATAQIYRVEQSALSFCLIEEVADPPLNKSYGSVLADADRLRRMGHVVVADLAGELIGVVAADLSGWNGRVQIDHLRVSPKARGQGVGRALLSSAITFARNIGAWCVWLETQNTNYAAVQFYQRCGFRLCGLDRRLYDPRTQLIEETALFFALDLTT
jgi:ribosomal protein S18 acetylase RimI-like enzyme